MEKIIFPVLSNSSRYIDNPPFAATERMASSPQFSPVPQLYRYAVCVCVSSLQLGLTLCSPVNCSPSGSSVHGILQARILGWVAMPSSRYLPSPGIKPSSLTSPPLTSGFFTTSSLEKPVYVCYYLLKHMECWCWSNMQQIIAFQNLL